MRADSDAEVDEVERELANATAAVERLGLPGCWLRCDAFHGAASGGGFGVPHGPGGDMPAVRFVTEDSRSIGRTIHRREGGQGDVTRTARDRVRALAEDAVRVGGAYERAITKRDAAVGKRLKVLAELDEAIRVEEAGVVTAVAGAAGCLGVDLAATVLGLSSAEVRRAARSAAARSAEAQNGSASPGVAVANDFDAPDGDDRGR